MFGQNVQGTLQTSENHAGLKDELLTPPGNSLAAFWNLVATRVDQV